MGDKPEPFGGAAEILGIQPYYDSNGNRLGTSMNRCAGNGCFDPEDNIPASCTNTLRIGFVNNTRARGLLHGEHGPRLGEHRQRR